MSTYHGIGLMSGTSADGLDICYARYSEAHGRWQGEILQAETMAYTPEWQQRLRAAHTLSGEDLAKLHTDFGHLQGLLLRRFLVQHGLAPQWVCAHGHTVFHQPKDRHFTLQIGCGETLATYLPCPLVTNLRTRDVAQGGEGAPLVPFGEQQLFAQHLFLNLGGIANLSAFAPTAGSWQLYSQRGPRPYVAYDIAPCGLVLNTVLRWAQPDAEYDAEGALAATGTLLPELQGQLEALPYYYLPPPRSLGWEWVEREVLPLLQPYRGREADVLHTWCHHLASRLAAELDRYAIRHTELLITGGGVRHTYLRSCIQQALQPLGIALADTTDAMIDFKEAYIFGYLGLMTLLRRPNVLAEVTGARTAVVAGSLHLPDGWGSPLL